MQANYPPPHSHQRHPDQDLGPQNDLFSTRAPPFHLDIHRRCRRWCYPGVRLSPLVRPPGRCQEQQTGGCRQPGCHAPQVNQQGQQESFSLTTDSYSHLLAKFPSITMPCLPLPSSMVSNTSSGQMVHYHVPEPDAWNLGTKPSPKQRCRS